MTALSATTTPAAMTGLQLSKAFYWEAVRPLLDGHFPRLAHAAALAGSGSEVLGYDDSTSTDHHWGPRVLLFVRPEDYEGAALPVYALLAQQLPRRFAGYPTNFSPPDPLDNGVQLLQDVQEGPVNHRVEVLTAALFIRQQLNYDIAQPLQLIDWLTFSEQKLLSITAGEVFHDAIRLEQVRSLFAYYPRDIWIYLLASGWTRIGQEEHLMGRAGHAGDELGSALIGARLVRDLMRLCFLMERTYAPYAKWFGTAFRRLRSGPELYAVLQAALAAATWQEREQHLSAAYERLAQMHNRLELTPAMPEETRHFFGRPFRVIALHGFAGALSRQISDPHLRQLASERPIGSVNLFSDSVDLVEEPRLRPLLAKLYDREE